MSSPQQKWLTGLKSTSLFRAPPLDLYERQTKTVAYVELFGQFASDSFPEDIAELVRDHYPHKEPCLLDDVLATFVLHHPEHGHTILHPLLSCVIDGTITFSKTIPPFGSFVSVFGVSSERDLTEQWALACGEILRLLTHYNRPIYKSESSADGEKRSSCDGGDSGDGEGSGSPDNGKRAPKRLLTPWITDSLLAAPLGTKSDYFRWCGGVLGKYAGGGDLRPPTTAVSGKGHEKHPQLLSSTPRWAVANGAAVISSVCDDEVARYETAELTAAAVPALLLPPPSTSLDEHLVAGLPPLEPFARLFHRYYAIATPGATQRLLLGLLEAPASWAPDALDAAVQLVELLRAAEDYSSSSFKLPENWFRLHFLRPMGAAMTMKQGIASDAAAALLFRLFSQPALLFPPRGHAQGAQVVQPLYGPPIRLDGSEEMEALATQANEEATAKGVASLMRDHGLDVEWRICVLWEAAYGLIPLDKSVVDLPELVIATPLQPPLLSWTLFRPFLRVLEHLPKGCPSQSCLRRIFSATVDAILRRTFPLDDWKEQKSGNFRSASGSGFDPAGMAELRALVHCLFTEAFLAPALASQLLSDALTVCLSHDTLRQGNGSDSSRKRSTHSVNKDRGAVASFDSYLIAAVCALACEVQLCTFSPVGSLNGATSSTYQARRLMSVLEGLVIVEPFSPGVRPNANSPNDLVEAAIVAAHVSRLLGRSRACTHALTAIVRCKWDPGVSSKAASILALVDGNDKAVEAVFDYADKLSDPSSDEKRTLSPKQAQKIINGFGKGGMNKEATLSLNASDVTNLLCGCNGVSTTVSDLLKAVLKQKQDLAVAIVPLLWQRLMSAQELPTSKEGTSAKQGWRQVVDAVCNVVLTYPEKATSVVLLQAERGLQPWITGDGGQERWRMNTRIVVLLSELLRLPNDPQVLGLIANAGTLLYQATDGMYVDGEPCTLPQLELLEAIAMAIKSLCDWKVSPRGLLILLKERLPAIVRCLSHESPRIRASGTSLLREIVCSDVLRASYPGDKAGGDGRPWLVDVEESLAWETHFRRAEGLPESFLASAAVALGCKLPPS